MKLKDFFKNPFKKKEGQPAPKPMAAPKQFQIPLWFRDPRGWRESREALRKQRLLKKQGHKYFNIHGVKILALNRKNAERKYKLYHNSKKY